MRTIPFTATLVAAGNKTLLAFPNGARESLGAADVDVWLGAGSLDLIEFRCSNAAAGITIVAYDGVVAATGMPVYGGQIAAPLKNKFQVNVGASPTWTVGELGLADPFCILAAAGTDLTNLGKIYGPDVLQASANGLQQLAIGRFTPMGMAVSFTTDTNCDISGTITVVPHTSGSERRRMHNVRDAGVTSGAGTTTTLVDSAQNWPVNKFQGSKLRMRTGALANTEITIISNTATGLTFATQGAAPGSGSFYSILHSAFAQQPIPV
jgi:hypothetical protein